MWRPIMLVLGIGALIGTGLGFVAASGAPQQLMAMIPTPAPTPLPPCRMEDGQPVADRMQTFLEEWRDTVRVAGATSRIALSGPVTQLQRIRRDAQGARWPTCAEQAKRHLVQAMDDTIDGFLAFMSGTDAYAQGESERKLRAAADQTDSLMAELARMGR
jgi:hypothetical protein